MDGPRMEVGSSCHIDGHGLCMVTQVIEENGERTYRVVSENVRQVAGKPWNTFLVRYVPVLRTVGLG
jgi:hypothetical protein